MPPIVVRPSRPHLFDRSGKSGRGARTTKLSVASTSKGGVYPARTQCSQSLLLSLTTKGSSKKLSRPGAWSTSARRRPRSRRSRGLPRRQTQWCRRRSPVGGRRPGLFSDVAVSSHFFFSFQSRSSTTVRLRNPDHITADRGLRVNAPLTPKLSISKGMSQDDHSRVSRENRVENFRRILLAFPFFWDIFEYQGNNRCQTWETR